MQCTPLIMNGLKISKKTVEHEITDLKFLTHLLSKYTYKKFSKYEQQKISVLLVEFTSKTLLVVL